MTGAPKTGSVAIGAPQVVPLHPREVPLVISLKVGATLREYNHGFKKPRAGFPREMRSEFSRAIMAANIGDEQEVPR